MGPDPGPLDSLPLSSRQLASHLLFPGSSLCILGVQHPQLQQPDSSFLGPFGLQLMPGLHQRSAYRLLVR